ncbi:hypothetical protein L0Z14_19110 [Burkholderia multivorans]|uniref:hypothetical protein n=1 Tax=Burkholderia multivorans TaxID=87883 RepID=UPI00201AB157|nr:hypothetical protein [Burkholderia multivorans]MCL4663033.1 hypothetical protein [Burkholderia multivorans]
MKEATNAERPWRDLTDPRRAIGVDDLEAGLKEPVFENLEIPEALGPVTITVDDHKIKRFSFTQDDYLPWYLQDGASPFDGARIGQLCLLGNDLVQLFTTRYRASKTVGFHTEEQMWFDSPVKLGERVTMKGTYVEAYERRGQGYVVMEAQATGEDGRSIVRHRGVEILRTVPGKIAGRGSATPEKRVTGEVSASARRIERSRATCAWATCSRRRSRPSRRSRRRCFRASASTCTTFTTICASRGRASCRR